MTLESGQRSFRGLTVGPDTNIGVVEEQGLEGTSVRDGDRDLPREDGSIPGLHLIEAKTVLLRLVVTGDDVPGSVSQVLDAFQPSREDQSVYTFANEGWPERFVRGRVVRLDLARTPETHLNRWQEIQVALKASDPRIYSSTLHQALVPIFGSSGGGFDLPEDLPFNMTASEQQLGVAVNAGTRDAYPRIVFQYVSGTVSGVELTNLTNGDVLDIDAAITSGQQLVADMDALIRATGDPVVSIGGSSRYGDWQLPRDPFRLSPGSNTLRFEVTGGGVAACSVQWRDTF